MPEDSKPLGRVTKCLGPAVKDRTTEDGQSAKAESSETSAEARLEKLEHLREKGLITQEEYDERRTRILDSL